MDKKIKFAVIGCGHIGKRHAEMVTRDPGAELVALCDIRPCEELGIEAYDVPFFSSLTELLQSGISIDVVNVCTRTACMQQWPFRLSKPVATS